MKKLNLLFAGIIALFFLAFCEKQGTNDMKMSANKGVKWVKIIEVVTLSTPEHPNPDVGPWLIPGKNNGGNRTCEEVTKAFGTEFIECGEKVDYDEDQGFLGFFPDWLTVTVDEEGITDFEVHRKRHTASGLLLLKVQMPQMCITMALKGLLPMKISLLPRAIWSAMFHSVVLKEEAKLPNL